MNVIVTGGTGFLGRNLIRCLCKEGYRVYVIVRPNSKNMALLPIHENVIPVLCNLREIEKNDTLSGKNYEAFYHFAWSGVNRSEIDDDLIQNRNIEESI